MNIARIGTNRRQTMKLKTTIELHAKALFRGVPIVGFSRPEEEEVRAMISRIPPELLFNIKQIMANLSLGVKHGKFIPETSTVMLNPRTFKLRQKFGKGPGWFSHMQLVVVHEICHSIFDGLSPQQKQQWYDLSGWKTGTGDGQAEPYVEKRPGWPPYTSEWTHKKGITFPRHYSEKSPDEDFADCFAFFLLGKPHQMSPNKKQFLQDLVNQKVKRYPQAAIFGPDSAFGERRLAYKSKSV